MAKTITRQTLKLFGRDGASSNFGEFGSAAAGTPVTTKTIATIQALTAWLNGWQDAVAAGQAPYLQDMNSAMYVLCYQLMSILQDGIADWDSGTSYYIGSAVRRTGTSEIYVSKIDDNLNQALPTAGTSDTNWQFVSGIISSVFRIGGVLEMNSQKITGLANATLSTDAMAFGQIPIVNPTAYTPTFSAGWGTVASPAFYYTQLGKMLHIWGTFVTGTTAASAGTITIPGGYTLDTAKMVASRTYFGSAIAQQSSLAIVYTSGLIGFLYYNGTDNTKVQFGDQVQSGLFVARLISAFFSSTQNVAVDLWVPVV